MLSELNHRRSGDFKLITCILPKGKAKPVIQALKDEKANICANVTSARGAGKISPLALRGVGEQTEKDILSVVVESREADALFEFIYERGEVNRPHGGLLYMAALGASTHFRLPDLEPQS